jgi:hypothetical protein
VGSRELTTLDREVTLLGRLVRRPIGTLFKLGLFVIRSRETSSVPRIIEILGETSTSRV